MTVASARGNCYQYRKQPGHTAEPPDATNASKNMLTSLRLTSIAAGLALALAAAAGCKNGSNATADRKPIPLAGAGAASSGIGAPGGDSADTRAVGSAATGEGDQPDDVRSGVAPLTVTPGAVRSTTGHQ